LHNRLTEFHGKEELPGKVRKKAREKVNRRNEREIVRKSVD